MQRDSNNLVALITAGKRPEINLITHVGIQQIPNNSGFITCCISSLIPSVYQSYKKKLHGLGIQGSSKIIRVRETGVIQQLVHLPDIVYPVHSSIVLNVKATEYVPLN